MTDDRERLARELRRRGARRQKSLGDAERELTEIADLLPAAVRAGITKMEIHRLTGIGRPTIDALLGERQQRE